MPFAVFRQHQRKLLAVFAILAMIVFVLSDTLPRWMNSGGVNNRDLVVAELYGKKVHLSDLARMNEKRQRANRFMYYSGSGNPTYFGGASRQELIDALILEHEADRLQIPDSASFARDWIDRETSGVMTPALFESILTRYEQRVGGEQLLSDIASQVRIALARQEIAVPVVTPLDVYRNYRDQTERASFKVVPVVVDQFTTKVPRPERLRGPRSSTTNTRTRSPIRPGRHLVSRSRAGSRPSTSPSTPTPLPSGFRPRLPKTSSRLITKAARKSSRSTPNSPWISSSAAPS